MTPFAERARRLSKPVSLLIVGVLAVTAVASASDRLAEANVRAGVLGKLSFGPAVLRNRARLSLENGGPADAAHFARQALAKQPYNQYALALLGSAALVEQDAETADAAFRAAAEFGWRDPTTQRYWLYASLSAGAPTLAAQRLDALLRTGKFTPEDRQALETLESTGEGRAALMSRIALRPPWTAAYVTDSAQLGPSALANRLVVLKAARERGIAFESQAVADLTDGLLDAGRPAEALAVWNRLGPAPFSEHGPLIRNGGFDRPAGSANPFEWRLVPSGDLVAEIAPAPAPLSGRALHVTSSNSVQRVAAQQTVVLPTGRAVIGWTATGPDAAHTALSVRCFKSSKRIATAPVSMDAAAPRFAFSVPDEEGCRAQIVQIASSGHRGNAEFWIDDVRLQLEGEE